MTKRTGGAILPRTEYKTSPHCVAYLDFLGGTDIILHDDQNKHLNTVNMILEDVLAESKIFARDVFIKIFSDNILLAVSTDNGDKNKKIENIINLVSNFVHQAADNGYLIRGAIAEGNFFHNDIIVYGHALVKVVHMEEVHAIYPRVIVTKEIAKLLPQYVYSCTDGLNAVNYSILDIGFDSVNYKDTLLSQLAAKKTDQKVRQKIMQAISDFNLNSRFLRHRGALSHEIITNKEIEESLI